MSMQLAPDFVFDPSLTTPPAATAASDTTPGPAAVLAVAEDSLGPLASLPGTWTGQGFNTIWRPFDGLPAQDHFLELNLTQQTLQFEQIQGPIPNRGLLQPDIGLSGVHYLQQIKDRNTGAGLHFEPGIWLTIPPTSDPKEPATVARLASIPHGTVMLAQGTFTVVQGPPTFEAVSITPFVIGNPSQPITTFTEPDLSKPSQFRAPSQANPAGFTQDMVNNPNSVLQAAIAGQTITETTVLTITSLAQPVAGGGTASTAFLQGVPGGTPNANADAAQVTATFWIETVRGQNGAPDFLQLQYTQTVLLNFNELSWPHVSVATLRLSSPGTP